MLTQQVLLPVEPLSQKHFSSPPAMSSMVSHCPGTYKVGVGLAGECRDSPVWLTLPVCFSYVGSEDQILVLWLAEQTFHGLIHSPALGYHCKHFDPQTEPN